MSLLAPEILLQTTLQSQVTNLMQNYATYGPSIYGNLPTTPFNYQQDAQNFWTQQGNSLTVMQGYAWQEQNLPLVALVLGSSDEVTAFQPIGEVVDVNYDATAGTYSEEHGSLFSTRYQLHVLSANANLTLYIALFVKWVLLSQRTYLTGEGLMEQRVSMGDLVPDPNAVQNESFPVYERLVTLTCTHWDSYEVDGIVPSGYTMDITASN